MMKKNLNELKGSELVEYYAELVVAHNENPHAGEQLKPVTKFRDLDTGRRRCQTVLSRLEAFTKQKGKRKKRGQRVNYTPCSVQSPPRVGTLKDKALKLAKKGCKPEQLIKLIEDYQKDSGGRICSTRYRGYQLLRLLNSQNGYGFEERNGKIYVIENEKD